MKLKNIFSAILCGALLLGSAACTDEVEYNPASQVEGEGLYLSDTGEETIDIEENATSLTIPVYRTNSQGVFTAHLASSVVDEKGNPVTDIFTVPSEVTFQDGATVADLTVGVDFNKVEALAEYTLNLKILDDQLTPYSNAECNYVISYAPWTPWYYYSTTDPGFYQQNSLWSYGYDCPVYIRYSLIDKLTLQVGVPSPFSDLDYIFYYTLNLRPEYQYNPDGKADEDAEYLENLPADEMVDITKLKMSYYVTSNVINSTLSSNVGDVWFGDAYTVCTQVWGNTGAQAAEFMDKLGYVRSVFNPVKGRFDIQVLAFTPDGYYFQGASGMEYLQLPGNFKEYTLALQYLGNFVDRDEKECAVIGVTRSADVAAYAYKLIDHRITDEEAATLAQEIMSDPEAELITETGDITFTLPAEGSYAIVAVGYDATSAAVCNTYLNFKYQSVQKNQEWEDYGVCEYTDGILDVFFNDLLAGKTWEVEVQRHKTEPGVYRIVKPYNYWRENYAVPLGVGDMFPLSEDRGFLVINAADPNGVYLPLSLLGVGIDENFAEDGATPIIPGQLASYSMAAYQMALDTPLTLEQCKQYGLCGKLEDGVITFPAETLIVVGTGEYGSMWRTNYEGTFRLDMSFVEAQVPQAAAANRPARLVGPLSKIMKRPQAMGKLQQSKLYNQQVVSHDEIVKQALKQPVRR